MNKSDLENVKPDTIAKWWSILEEINWDENCHKSSDVLAKIAYAKHGYDFIHACKYARHLKSELYRVVDGYEKANSRRCGNYGGDDSFSDMLWHVIGKGKEYYESVMADPTILDTLEYKESFSYVMVDSHAEAEKFSKHYHIERAYAALGYLYVLKETTELNENDVVIVKELTDRFMNMINNDFEAACADFANLPSPAGYSDIYKRYSDWDANPACALFSNCLCDAARCMLDDTTPSQPSLL